MEKKYRRRKAFIGAIIGAGLSIAGGLIGGAKKKREAKRQAAIDKRNREYDKKVQDANAINEALASYDDGGAGEEFEARLQKYGGVTKYKNRKAWGGWGDVISGTVSGIGSLVEGATGVQGISGIGSSIGNAVGGAIKGGYTNRMIQKNEQKKQETLAAPLANPVGINPNDYRQALPTRLQPVKRYGGRKPISVMACGGKKKS